MSTFNFEGHVSLYITIALQKWIPVPSWKGRRVDTQWFWMCLSLSQQHYTSQDLFQVEKGDKRILRVRCLPLKVVVEVARISRIENALQSKTFIKKEWVGVAERDLRCKRAFSSLTGLVKASNVVRVEENPERILEEGGVLCSHHNVNRLLVKKCRWKKRVMAEKIFEKPATAEALLTSGLHSQQSTWELSLKYKMRPMKEFARHTMYHRTYLSPFSFTHLDFVSLYTCV